MAEAVLARSPKDVQVTTFFLVRHATHALLDRVLAGRMQGVSLNLQGRIEAGRLAVRFAQERLDRVQSSPRERACETAAAITATAKVPLEIVEALDEVDVGEWTGRPFAELSRDPRWRSWNAARTRACAPGGEAMSDAQARIVTHLERMHRQCPGARIAMVTHAEIIRAAVLHHLGLPLEAYDRIEISPASMTILRIGKDDAELTALNQAVAA